MNSAELDSVLRQTLDDRRLSRSEKRALKDVLADIVEDEDDRAQVRARVFAIAKETLAGEEAGRVIEWMKDVVNLVHAEPSSGARLAEVLFSPGDECLRRITRLLKEAKHSADICVFTITDDRLAQPILEAHRSGISVRVISDNDKAFDRGSDVDALGNAGVPVRFDRSEHHMHHKYALFDGSVVVTGSYNWTRSAAAHNRENIVVTDDARIVAPYQRAFDALWSDLA